MVNDPFSDLPFFFVVNNPYESRSQIRFWILTKNAPSVQCVSPRDQNRFLLFCSFLEHIQFTEIVKPSFNP